MGEKGGPEGARREGREGIGSPRDCCVGLQVMGEKLHIAGLEVQSLEPDEITALSRDIEMDVLLLGSPNPLPPCVLAQAYMYAREFILIKKNKIKNIYLLILIYITGETQISKIIRYIKKNKIKNIYIIANNEEKCIKYLKYIVERLGLTGGCERRMLPCKPEDLASLASVHLSILR